MRCISFLLLLIVLAVGISPLFAQVPSFQNHTQEESIPDTTYILDIAWSPDGTRLAAVGISYPIAHGYIRVFDMLTRQAQYTLTPPSSGFISVAWSPDAKYLAVAGYDQVIWVIDTETGEHIQSMRGHQSTITQVDWNHDGTQLVSSGNWDGLTILWDMQIYEQIRNVEEANLFPSAVAFSPDGQRIAVGGEGGTRIYTVDNPEAPPVTLTTDATGSLEWNSNGDQIAIGTQTFPSIINPNNWVSAKLIIFDALTGIEISNIPTFHETMTNISWSLDEPFIAFYSRDNSVNIWDISQQEEISSYFSHDFNEGGVDYSAYGAQLAYGSSLLSASNFGEAHQSRNGTWQLDNGLIQIIVPAPSLDRLQSIAQLCGAPADLQLDSLEAFTEQLELLNIPPACRADLIAIVTALQEE